MFLRSNKRIKDGKEHRYWSIVENRRTRPGKTTQKTLLYLGEINDSERASWTRAIGALDESRQPRQINPFPEDRTPDPTFIFPGVGRRWKRNLRGKPLAQQEAQRLAMNEATAPMSTSTVQNALKLAVVSLHFKKRITPHTLRHCYATHLLDKGVNLRHISSYPGHASLNETLVYLHLSSIGEEQTHAILKDIHREVIAPRKQPSAN